MASYIYAKQAKVNTNTNIKGFLYSSDLDFCYFCVWHLYWARDDRIAIISCAFVIWHIIKNRLLFDLHKYSSQNDRKTVFVRSLKQYNIVIEY